MRWQPITTVTFNLRKGYKHEGGPPRRNPRSGSCGSWFERRLRGVNRSAIGRQQERTMAEPLLSCAPQKVPSYTPLCVPHTSTSSIEPRHAGSGARLIRPTYPAKGSALEVTEAGQSPPHPPWLSNFLSESKEGQHSPCAPRGGRVGNDRFSFVLPAAPDQRSACLSEAKRQDYACLDSVMVSGARGCTGTSLGSRAPIDSQ